MYRERDLRMFVGTMGAALAGPIMADVGSDRTRGIVRGLIEMLDRLASDLGDGDAMAADIAARWAEVEAGAPFAIPSTPSASSPRRALDDRILATQEAMETPETFDRVVALLGSGDGDARRWLVKAGTLFEAYHRDLERSFARMAERPALSLGGSDPQALRAKLAAYLAARFSELPADPITAFAVVAGGNSKLTALFELAPNPVLPQHVVLRLDIANSITGARLEEEYPILQRVHALGLPVPAVYLFEPDSAPLGGAFLLMEQVRDAQIAGSPFPEDRRRDGSTMGPEFGVEAARIVATLHAKTLETPGEKPELTQRLNDDIDRLWAEWRTLEKPPHALSVDLGVAWMRAHPLPPGRPTCLLHADVAPHNFLTRDGHAVALLDWELARRGDPSEDLAQIKMMLLDGVIAWPDFVDAYIAAGGPPEACDPHAVSYYQQFVYLRHGVNQTRLRNCYLRGERTDLSAALIASHYQDRITLYQSIALEEAARLDL